MALLRDGGMEDRFPPVKPCRCGSGLPSRWLFDARGIELCRACDKCEAARLRGYRPEVLTDGGYEADEAIEADDDCRHLQR